MSYPLTKTPATTFEYVCSMSSAPISTSFPVPKFGTTTIPINKMIDAIVIKGECLAGLVLGRVVANG